MTTDTDALQESIARVLHKTDPIGGHSPDWKRLSLTDREWYVHKAAAVLPIAAEEVAKALRAEAHALMEDIDEGPVTEKDIALFQVRDRLIHRATEYETGDSDEHR